VAQIVETEIQVPYPTGDILPPPQGQPPKTGQQFLRNLTPLFNAIGPPTPPPPTRQPPTTPNRNPTLTQQTGGQNDPPLLSQNSLTKENRIAESYCLLLAHRNEACENPPIVENSKIILEDHANRIEKRIPKGIVLIKGNETSEEELLYLKPS